MRNYLRKILVYVLGLSVISLGSPLVARAELIGTLTAIESQQRAADLATVTAAMAQSRVRERMAALGVDPQQVETRIASLTDSELRSLAQQIDSMPAGSGALAVLGVVFLVLLVLELVGVIDIFKKFP